MFFFNLSKISQDYLGKNFKSVLIEWWFFFFLRQRWMADSQNYYRKYYQNLYVLGNFRDKDL